MKVKTSYPIIVNGVEKTPDLYYDADMTEFSDGEMVEYSEARGKRRRRRPTAKKRRRPIAKRRRPVVQSRPMATRPSVAQSRPIAQSRPTAPKRPLRPVSLKDTRVVTLGSGTKFDKRVMKTLDKPQFYNAGGNEEAYNVPDSGLKVFTTYPVTVNNDKISPDDYFLNADGEQYLPFDGQSELLGFRDELGEEYFCGVDGEEFYNAKGEKLKGFFKKVGGGVVKVGKFIGKIAKKVGRAVVKASKTVAKGVKKVGGKVKAGAKKLIHHKTKEEKAQSKSDRDKRRADRVKEHNDKKAKRDKEIADAKAKGQTPPPPLPPLPPQTPQEKEEELKFTQKEKQEEKKTPDANASDVFTLTLPLANANTPKDKIVVINGIEYDASGIPDTKQIVETIDESGNPVAGVEFNPSEVVATTGEDGNVQYYTNQDAGGMSKGLKITLIVAGSLLVLGVVGYFIYKSKKGSSVPK
jgi:hypothetical protein